MVDWFGRWTAEKDYTDYPKDKMCDCDRLAIKLMNDNYNPITSIENIIEMVFSFYNEDYKDYGGEYNNIDDCYEYVKDSGGWNEFDYVV